MTDPLRAAILKVVNENFESTGKALLLARLGQQLNRTGIDFRSQLNGEKLAAFVRRTLADDVVVIQHPTDSLVHGLVPKAQALLDNTKTYFTPSASAGSTEDKDRLVFDKRLWAAFSFPLSGTARTILIQPPTIHFEDHDEEPVSLGENEYRVDNELIVPFQPVPDETRNDKIKGNILGWISKLGLDLDSLTVRNKRSVVSVSSVDHSLLTEMISRLSAAELQRVSMSLDVVARLMEVKVGRHK